MRPSPNLFLCIREQSSQSTRILDMAVLLELDSHFDSPGSTLRPQYSVQRQSRHTLFARDLGECSNLEMLSRHGGKVAVFVGNVLLQRESACIQVVLTCTSVL